MVGKWDQRAGSNEMWEKVSEMTWEERNGMNTYLGMGIRERRKRCRKREAKNWKQGGVTGSGE